MHLVKCAVCGERFDRDKYSAVVVGGRRYAHAECRPDLEVEASITGESKNKDLIELENIIKQLFGTDYITPKVQKQINDFIYNPKYADMHMTYGGMSKSLYYFFIIKKNPIEKANEGIGIVPLIYKEAEAYYFRKFMADKTNSEIEFKKESKEIWIDQPIQKKKNIKLWKMED